jgi:nitric oxide dioxygenase
MTPKQIKLIEDSWDFVIINTTEAGMIFYSRLFQLDPSLRPLFKDSIDAQSKKLVSMITFIVHKLNKLDEVTKDIKALGQRHGNYKVKPEYYKTVGEALLWTLERSLGEQWNDELKEAWVTVYGVLSKTMIEASSKVNVL